MKISKWIHIVLIGCSIIALTACSSHRRHDQAAIEAANVAYGNPAEQGAYASGISSRTSFKDHGDQGQQFRGVHSVSTQSIAQRVYYFDFDKDVVHDVDKPAIVANGNYLAEHAKIKVILEGHTDPRGSREYNIGLGERRAKAVASILTANGVALTQIRVVSYGAEKLARPGHTEADYQQDRRVVLVYLK